MLTADQIKAAMEHRENYNADTARIAGRELYRQQGLRLTAMENALKTLVEMYVANRGRPTSEFIACITPPHASEMTPRERKREEHWKAWDAARLALGETVKWPDKT
jgi:hypothetical protein